MVRLSKQVRIRMQSRRRPRPPAVKTGSKKDKLAEGFKPALNAAQGDLAKTLFIPVVK